MTNALAPCSRLHRVTPVFKRPSFSTGCFDQFCRVHHQCPDPLRSSSNARERHRNHRAAASETSMHGAAGWRQLHSQRRRVQKGYLQ